VLLMLWIADRLQQIVESGYAATVLWRSVSFTRQADRISTSGFRWKAFLDCDSVVPAITEVIGLHSLYSRPAQHAE